MAVLSRVPGRRWHGRALRIAVAVGCALAAGAAGPGNAGAAVGSAAAVWAGPYTIPDTNSNSNPALASYGGQLYAVWAEASSSPYQIMYSAFDSTTRMWSTPAAVPSALTGLPDGPAAAVYHGDLYVAWEGQSSSATHIWYSAYNGTSWTAQAQVPSALTDGSVGGNVGLAAYGGDLYLAWAGANGGSLWDSAFNGTTWTAQAKIPGTTDLCQNLVYAAALASYSHLLYMAWTACDPSELVYATFDGTSWSSPAQSGPFPNSSAALAVKGSTLYESWIESAMPLPVEWASFKGTTWTSAKTIPGSSTDGYGPAMASYGGALFDAWTSGAGPIEYAERV